MNLFWGVLKFSKMLENIQIHEWLHEAEKQIPGFVQISGSKKSTFPEQHNSAARQYFFIGFFVNHISVIWNVHFWGFFDSPSSFGVPMCPIYPSGEVKNKTKISQNCNLKVISSQNVLFYSPESGIVNLQQSISNLPWEFTEYLSENDRSFLGHFSVKVVYLPRI